MISNSDLYKAFPKGNTNSLRTYANEIRKLDISNDIPKIERPGVTDRQNQSIKTGLQPLPGITKPSQKGLNSSLAPTSTGGGALSLTREVFRTFSEKKKLKVLKDMIYEDYIFDGKDKNLKIATDIGKDKEFLLQGEVKHGIYWTSDTPCYTRPGFLYPWQPKGIKIMRSGHCLRLGSRQKDGKTMEAALADFEDMLEVDGVTITLIAPTAPLARGILHQMFHERIALKTVVEDEKSGLWRQIPTGEFLDLWEDLFEPYFKTDNKEEKIMWNGSRIRLWTLNVSATQGLSSDVIHIEELDKITKLTKEGKASDKLEALAGALPQIRARPHAKIRITCNNRSGLFNILKRRLFKFGMFFPIYQEEARSMDLKGLVGRHIIINQDAIWMCDPCRNNHLVCTHEPDVDDFLEVLMGIFAGEGFVKAQIYMQDDFAGEAFSPDKLELAYEKGLTYVEKDDYEDIGMSVDPGGVHATAYTILAIDPTTNIFAHLWSKNYIAASPHDKNLFDSMSEQEFYEVAYEYVLRNCKYFTYESNSGFIKQLPLIQKNVDKLLAGYEYIKKEWVKTYRFSKTMTSKAVWYVRRSNFGTESPEGVGVKRGIPKGEYVANLRLILDLDLLILQERTRDEMRLGVDLSLYDPAETAEKYKGDQAESLLHNAWHLAKKNIYYQKIITRAREGMKYAY